MRVNLRKLNLVLGVVAAVLVAGSLLLPYLNRAREGGGRIRCPSNMAQLGKAMLLYGNDNRGQLPSQLTDLFSQDVTPEVFCCPSSREEKAPGETTAELTAQIHAAGLPTDLHEPRRPEKTMRHCSYIYVGKGLTWPVDEKRVLLYEPLTNHDNDGINILFGDGHVEWQVRKEAEETIRNLSMK
jgi:prepilin-type processing-associated H-X9-DG protein